MPFFLIQKLISLISEVNPTSLFVALDVGKSFRKDLSPKYKAHRKPKPRSMQEQVQKHKNLSSKLKTKIDKIDCLVYIDRLFDVQIDEYR